MKSYIQNLPNLARFVVLALLSTLNPQLSTFAQGAAFTYQGRLMENGAPANGSNDFTFTLYTAATGGATVGASSVTNDLVVTNGLFTVTLDYGPSAFDGSARWLQIAVRPGASAGAYTNLAPRQPITPTPYAIRALNAGSATTASSVAAGAVTSSGLASGAVGATAIADGSISSADLDPSLLNNTFWKLVGNDVAPGQFIGSSNDLPVELRVFNQRALRLEPRGVGISPNVLGGYSGNTAGTFHGAAIAGGGAQGAINRVAGDYAFIGAGHGGQPGHFAAVVGGAYNNSLGQFSFVGTGQANTNLGLYAAIVAGSSNAITASADHAFIGGGQNNMANNTHATVSGGEANHATSWATVGGGKVNQSDGAYATVGGGRGNISGGIYATVPGGYFNMAAGQSSFAAGTQARANHQGSFVWADSLGGPFDSTADNQFLIRAVGNVGINKPNPASALDVNGTVTATGFRWAASSEFSPDQGGSLELGDSLGSGTVPFIDFHYGVGSDQDHNVRLINNADGVLSVEGAPGESANVRVTGSVVVDQSGLNAGNVFSNSLTFGTSSGEGIASRRSGPGGGNQYGLDFFTGFQDRMTILNNGNVGIGTTTPASALHVIGTVTATRFIGNAGATLMLGTTDNQPLEFKVNNQRALRLEPGGSNSVNVIGGWMGNGMAPGVVGATIGGGGAGDYFGSSYTNRVEADFGTVSGGRQNTVQTGARAATISGGERNAIEIHSIYGTIGGGVQNVIEGTAQFATIGGGLQNMVNYADYATIGGGEVNAIQTSAGWATIGGGIGNSIQTSAGYATIGGGNNNTIQPNAFYATIPGGLFNSATNYAFAAGRRAKANHNGAFVWSDSQNNDFASTTSNQFNIRASGGVRLSDDTPNLSFGATTRQMLNLYSTNYGIGVQGGTLYFRCDGSPGHPLTGFRWYRGGAHHDELGNAGGGTELMSLGTNYLYVNGTFVSMSDRNVKAGFAPVDAREILAKVAALPITRWHYTNNAATTHLGPMAQDFYAAFGVGPDDKHITTVDESGVALAAIQGLNQKVEEKEARIAELERRLEKLERLMDRENGGAK